jgi:hypothetical protein
LRGPRTREGRGLRLEARGKVKGSRWSCLNLEPSPILPSSLDPRPSTLRYIENQ